MDESEQRLVQLVETLVVPLIDDTDALSIETAENEEGSLVINITVSEDETGKVIGRQGRVIKAIRTLVRAAASKDEIPVEVEVIG